jgi:GGDEF domain-containing protein
MFKDSTSPHRRGVSIGTLIVAHVVFRIAHCLGSGLNKLGAQQVAESVRREMAALAMVLDGKTIPVTVSIGVATAGSGDLVVAALIQRADD